MEKSRDEIERALLTAVQQARTSYERAKKTAVAARQISLDVEPLNSDHTLALQHENQANAEVGRALVQYRDALHRFNDFLISGKVPDGE